MVQIECEWASQGKQGTVEGPVERSCNSQGKAREIVFASSSGVLKTRTRRCLAGGGGVKGNEAPPVHCPKSDVHHCDLRGRTLCRTRVLGREAPAISRSRHPGSDRPARARDDISAGARHPRPGKVVVRVAVQNAKILLAEENGPAVYHLALLLCVPRAAWLVRPMSKESRRPSAFIDPMQ